MGSCMCVCELKNFILGALTVMKMSDGRKFIPSLFVMRNLTHDVRVATADRNLQQQHQGEHQGG